MITHFYGSRGRKKDHRSRCGKLLSEVPDDDYSTVIEAVTCKDCLTDQIQLCYKRIFRLKKLIKHILAQIASLGIVLIFLVSCAIPKNDKNSKCLKWEFGKCVWILNKDKEK